MAPERLARAGTVAGDHVEHPARHARLVGELGDAHRGHRGLLGRLDDHAVARGQGRTQLPREHHQREVPRQHRADHPDGLAHDHRHGVVADRRGLVVDLVDGLGVPQDALDGLGHVDRGAVADRLARVQALHHRELVAVALQQLAQAHHHALAVPGVHARPVAALERLARAAHRQIHIIGIAGGELAEHRAGGRIAGLERAPRLRGPVGAVDVRIARAAQLGRDRGVLVTR
ncbi:MAG: hypothetical protein U5K43_08520 [Halofilum sp. (in: g-proteobacteria)]|nr:hypothetical protein [Halofilum sp. (in: g-proteobacteria)]